MNNTLRLRMMESKRLTYIQRACNSQIESRAFEYWKEVSNIEISIGLLKKPLIQIHN